MGVSKVGGGLIGWGGGGWSSSACARRASRLINQGWEVLVEWGVGINRMGGGDGYGQVSEVGESTKNKKQRG